MSDPNQENTDPSTKDPSLGGEQGQGSAPASGAGTQASTPKPERKPRADKGQPKAKAAKPKAKAVRIPVSAMQAVVIPKDQTLNPKFVLDLTAMTASTAEDEVLKKATTKEFAEKMAGAKVQIIALVDTFTVTTETTVKTAAKR